MPLPPDIDVQRVAAAMNPAMSSWVALRRRIGFLPGQSVLVLGATGSAGRVAVQIARRLGARTVVAAGRDSARLGELATLGADRTVSLVDDPDDVATRLGDGTREVDVVLDYLWGTPAEQAIVALVTRRPDRGRALDWIQIGSVAGATAAIPSAALRATNLRVLGSGQGSVPTADIVAELPELARLVGSGEIVVDAHAVPLADVEHVWNAATAHRVVLTPTRT